MEGGLCFFHANPAKASELGRIGGRSKRLNAGESLDQLPNLDTAHAVRATLTALIPKVLTGELQPKVASVLAPLLSLQLRVIQTTDLERRVEELEKRATVNPEDDFGRDDK
jgi:hypothetical protein